MVLKSTLATELASPSVGGIRSAWTWRPLASMSPAGVADVLRRAAQGDGHDFLLAAADIEEKDLHYASVLQTRKLAVAGLPIKLTPADNSRRAKQAATLCEDVLARLDMPALIIDLLDAVSKGYGVTELMWDTRGTAWMPVAALHREPQWFAWDRASGQRLRLVDGSAEGQELPDYKFVLHTPKIRSGIPLMGGLARSALWAWVFKSHALRDWASFCELFGQPMRVGKYGMGADPKDVAVLRRAVTELGSDAAAVIPDSMVIDFVESGGKSASADLYQRLIVYMDGQISKCVLGQTGTTDMGGSYAQSKVHDEVRTDLLRADARALASTLVRDVLRPVVMLNMGPDAPMPTLELVVEEPEDMSALVDQLAKLVPLGLSVEQAWVRDKWGIPQPKDGAELLAQPAPAPTPAPTPTPAPATTADPATPAATRVAAQAQQPTDQSQATAQTLPPDGVDAIHAELLGDDGGWVLMEPLLAPMQAAMAESAAQGETAAQLLDRLAALLPGMDGTAMTSALARAAFTARLAGQGGMGAV